MKIIFNDATELQVQKVEQKGDYLRVLTVSATPEQLRRIFEDIVKTATMVVEERGQKGEPLVGYTTFYRTEEYPGKIYGIVQYRPERTPEAQTEVQEAAIIMAKIQAESLQRNRHYRLKLCTIHGAEMELLIKQVNILHIKISCTRYFKIIHLRPTGHRTQLPVYTQRYLQIHPGRCCLGSSHKAPIHIKKEIE